MFIIEIEPIYLDYLCYATNQMESTMTWYSIQDMK